jgi:hypothetical protein
MIQLSLFHFPDEAPRLRAEVQFQSEKWDQWWLTMLRGPQFFPDDDEDSHDWHGAGHTVPRQTSFAGFL